MLSAGDRRFGTPDKASLGILVEALYDPLVVPHGEVAKFPFDLEPGKESFDRASLGRPKDERYDRDHEKIDG